MLNVFGQLLRHFYFFLFTLFLLTPLVVSAEPLTTAGTADVIIVGAGLAGLSTAYRLKKAGKSFIILEMSSHIGGRIRTASYVENVSAELGLEEFWDKNPTLEIFRELKVPLEKSATCFSSFITGEKLNTFTQNTNMDFLKSFLNAEEFKAYKDWDTKTAKLYAQIGDAKKLTEELKKLMNISFKDWVVNTNKLPVKVQELIRIESEPEYGVPWDRISALDGIAEWHIFSGEGSGSFHVIGGNHKGALAIADHIGRANILLGRQVTNIKANDKGVDVIATDADYHQQTYHGKYVVTTPPLFRLNEIQFEPALAKERNQAIQSQTWGAYFTAHIIVDAKASKYWTKDGESILPILTDSPLGVIYGGNENPEESQNTHKKAPSHYILNLLVTGDTAEGFNLRLGNLDDVRETLLKHFEKLWPGFKKHVTKQVFYRYHPRAIASYPIGRSRFDQLSQLMREPQGRIYFAGDFTENTHSDGAAQSAIRVVEQILKAERK